MEQQQRLEYLLQTLLPEAGEDGLGWKNDMGALLLFCGG